MISFYKRWRRFWANRKGPGSFDIKYKRKELIASEKPLKTTTGEVFNPINIIDTLPWHPKRKWRNRDLSDINNVVFHQSMSGGSTTGINKYHINPNHISSRGIPHIAYHFSIEKNGTVFQCNELSSITWHTKGDNFNGIGVLVLGDFEGPGHYASDIPTKAQKKSMLKIMLYLYNLDDISISADSFFPHSKYGKKACPGNMLTVLLEDYKIKLYKE